ncbi:hypothetical protein CEQ30_32955 [Nocardia brasiliensis]|nr:hypothetical protein CEQ30_32955 [Nocardia brasiliensis]
MHITVQVACRSEKRGVLSTCEALIRRSTARWDGLLESEYFTYLPAAVVDADGSLVSQLNDTALRRLARTAAGLSVEAQQYLTMLANQLRDSEGLPGLDVIDG